MVTRRFISKGHLIDSGLLTQILNSIIEEQADYEIIRFEIGKTNDKESVLEIELLCDDHSQLGRIEDKLILLGCYEKAAENALWKTAQKDKSVPEDFYSSSNHKTEVYYENHWHEVNDQRMDGVLVLKEDGIYCRKLRDVKEGDAILCNSGSVRLFPPNRERNSDVFGFMSNDVSSERSVHIAIEKIAEDLKKYRQAGKKVIAVAGPVLIHTGGSEAFSKLIRDGYIHGVLAGNALAVHDLESVFFGTSLGVDLKTGKPIREGHRNHMAAINRINSHGSIRKTVEAGVLNEGIMYEIIKKDIPYCLAGSIRDDGPLPETVTDMIEAQAEYAQIIKGASAILMLSSMLHSIGTGNMLPSWVKTICVDINPAVVTKLSDRGSSQTLGIVSDVGLFLRELAAALSLS